MEKKDVFYSKAKLLDIRIWETMSIVLNEKSAWEHWIREIDKVWMIYDWWKETVVNADLSTNMVGIWEVGITKDVYEKFGIKNWDIIGIYFTMRSGLSVEAIRKKMRWEDINYDEIFAIIKDISENKLTDTLMTYYVASSFFNETSNDEMYLTAKAMAENWVTFKYPKWTIVADKHCIWWVPWNETSMIIIPTVASLWIKMPKNFSKAITSPAATGECVNVLMWIEFTKQEIEKLIEENNCCLVWWWALDLAPADDKIIRVSYPLSMQNIAKVVSSIMAKKYAMWITHSLIDIPVGPTAKVADIETAMIRKEKFEYVWEKLGMKMNVVITEAKQPIGSGIWATLQVREVLRVLQQNEKRPKDLEEKAMKLSAKIVEMVGLASGEDALKLVYNQLKSGKSREMMQKIIKSQSSKISDNHRKKYYDWPAWEVDSESIKSGILSKDVLSEKDQIVKSIDMKYLNSVARSLWCPLEDQAWVFFNKKVWDTVLKWEVLYTIYANDQHKLDMAISMLNEKSIMDF